MCRYARRLTGDRPLHAVMGGFHLNGPLFEPLIPRVLEDFAALAPSFIVPAHCTGWRAQHAIGRRFPKPAPRLGISVPVAIVSWAAPAMNV
jgi:7,8-dihydropterin-6-yl-methyl-4-(beta-D-ribofuranosyl)aminobenzene 5'-phosphate synthase